MRIELPAHALLRVRAFATSFPTPLGRIGSPASLLGLLQLDAAAPLTRDEAVRAAVRDMLRANGYKPTGRGKPASEYLVRAAQDGSLAGINVAVDACNAVSLHSGLPISVIDLDRTQPPYRIGLPSAGAQYVFNAAGQEIAVGGLVSLFDGAGPCANAVKDAQRTKTNDGTTRTLSIVWGCAGHEDRLNEATSWYRALLQDVGATTDDVPLD
jgi:DNA/RNA-binding domain of Phe-tRNA-synthetase-like protein